MAKLDYGTISICHSIILFLLSQIACSMARNMRGLVSFYQSPYRVQTTSGLFKMISTTPHNLLVFLKYFPLAP